MTYDHQPDAQEAPNTSLSLSAPERRLLTALANSLSTAIFVVDGEGSVILCNEAALVLTGADADIQGKDFADILPLRDSLDAASAPVRLIDGRIPVQRRRGVHLAGGNGHIVDLEVTVRPLEPDNPDSTDYVVVCENIAQERSLDEQRSEFISVASHELRTPVAIMEASLSAALHDNADTLPAATRSLISQAHDSAVYLATIIRDLSTLAESHGGSAAVQLRHIDALKLGKQLVSDFESQAEQKGLIVTLDADPKSPAVLSAERHIREVLQNYMTNAIKYTMRGEIVLSIVPANDGGVIFCVRDTGIGIAPADQKHLFTKYFRAEDYRTRTTNGTGLGLYLCQELANRIGARVWCESKLNAGSAFYLQVPPVGVVRPDHG